MCGGDGGGVVGSIDFMVSRIFTAHLFLVACVRRPSSRRAVGKARRETLTHLIATTAPTLNLILILTAASLNYKTATAEFLC